MGFSTRTLLFITFNLISTSLFAEECTPWDLSFLQKSDLVIGKIEVNTENIFNQKNSKENRLIHRTTNKLHIKTRIATIKNQLLFSSSDKFQLHKLVETERNLRRLNYIRSAHVTPLELCGNQVNILVKTWDNWTLTPGVTFSRSGGNNRTGVEIQEHNLFGFGKSLSLSYRQGAERNTKLFKYLDPQLFGSRKRLLLSRQDNSDGNGYAFDLGKPFYELDSKSSWGVRTSKLKQKTSLYQQAEVFNKITNEEENFSVFYGWSKGRLKKQKADSITRFRVGWTYSKTDFLKSSNALLKLPTTIKESYPWIEINQFKDKYITKTNYQTMGVIEDVPFGQKWTLGLGLLQKSLGSDNNYLKLSAAYSKGFSLGSNNIAFINLHNDSYISLNSHPGSREGNTSSLNLEYDHFNQNGNDFFVSSTLRSSDNLKQNQQIILGGGTGLRGYPKAFSTGTKSFIVQAEKRFHFNWYPLHLAKFGAVVFSDIGTIWGGDDTNNGKLLADVGIGLRMIPTRSSSAKTIQFDLAFPLTKNKNGNTPLDNYQFLIRTNKTF